MENISGNESTTCDFEETDHLLQHTITNNLNCNQEKIQHEIEASGVKGSAADEIGIVDDFCGKQLNEESKHMCKDLANTNECDDEKKTVCGKKLSKVKFNTPLNPESSFISKENKPDVDHKTSKYIARASTMRSKIEEKITEIENKINLPSLDSSSESIDAEPSPADYNLIKVLDARRFRSCSVSEMRQNTIDRLQSKLEKAEKDLELREEEVLRLRKIRDEVGSEIEDLTASLFEEANNMVRNAHVKQQKADKRAKEANMKLGMLQEEVRALKTIVQSTKMYSTASDNQEILDKGNAAPSRETYEVDPIFHEEFVKWRQNPTLDKEIPFIKRIYREDFNACLHFQNSELSTLVLSAIEEDKITIEKIPVTKSEPLPKHCALLDAPRLCTYKMCLDGKSYNISTLSRNRITAVCDLFCYFRYIQKGLITLRIHEVYLEILKKRRRITSAKLGLIDDVVQ